MVEVDEPWQDQQWQTRRCTGSAKAEYAFICYLQGINIHLPVLRSRQNPSLRYLAASSALIFVTVRLPFFTSRAAGATSVGFLERSVDSSVTAGAPWP